VLARFDRLDTLQRFILQIASVIGKDFSMPVLSAVTQKLGISTKELHQSIDQLLQREYIFVVEGSYDSDYSFRHILMSDAIYSTMLRKERNILHGEIADTIESLYANQLDEQIDILANHYRWSPNREKALHYLILAGQKADRNQLNEQSRNHYEEAYQILSTIEHKPFQAYQVNHGLGDVHVFCGEYPEARKFYKKATQILINNQPKEHIAEIGSLFRKTARTYERQGNYDEALQYLSKAEKTIHNSQEPLLVEQAEVWNDIAWIHFRRGNFLEAGNLLEKALVLALESDSSAVIASIYNRLAGVAYNQGNWDNTTAYLRESIKIRESSRDLSGLSSSINNLGLLEMELGKLNNAYENLKRSFELKKRLGQTEGVALTLNNMGWLQIQRGEFDSAKEFLEEAFELSTNIGYSSLEGEVLKNQGELYLAMKNWGKAIQKLKLSAKALNELQANDQLIDTYRLLGEVSLGKGDTQEALEYARIVHQLAKIQLTKTDKLPAVQQGELFRFEGMLAIHLQKWNDAISYFRESKETFQKISSRLYQGRTLLQMGIMATKLGDTKEAKDYLTKAEQLFSDVGAKEEAERVRNLLSSD
jgi:tetratricopeptide (TPR) repeat protein